MLAIFLFYDQTRNPFANIFTFSKTHKHVDVFTFDGSRWLLFRYAKDGITYLFSAFDDGRDIIEHLKKISSISAIVCTNITTRYNQFAWFPFWTKSCNEFARLITGIDVGFTLNPRHLYNKLLKYDGKSNYLIISSWSRNNG